MWGGGVCGEAAFLPPALKDVVSEKRRLESRRPIHAYPAGLWGGGVCGEAGIVGRRGLWRGGDCGEAAFLPPALKDVVSEKRRLESRRPIHADPAGLWGGGVCGEAGIVERRLSCRLH